MRQRPGAFGRARHAILPEEHTRIAQILVAAGEAGGEVVGAEGGEMRDEVVPDRAEAPGRVEQFVGDAGQRPVGGE
jgi:hypothetical protein